MSEPLLDALRESIQYDAGGRGLARDPHVNLLRHARKILPTLAGVLPNVLTLCSPW